MAKKIIGCLIFLAVLTAITPWISAKAGAGIITGKVNVSAQYSENWLVFLKIVPGEFSPMSAKMDQVNKVFIPNIIPIIVGSEVDFLNSDTVNHNVRILGPFDSPFGKLEDLGNFPRDKSGKYIFAKLDPKSPYNDYWIHCSIHSEMSAWIIVLQNPYFTFTDENGNYKIENVPDGRYQITLWFDRNKLRKDWKKLVKKNVMIREVEIKNNEVVIDFSISIPR